MTSASIDATSFEEIQIAYQEAIEKHCFDSFKALTTSHSKDITLNLVESMCNRGLTSFLIYTEQLITERDRTSMCHHDFLARQRQTLLSNTALHNASTYANFLIEVGRLQLFKISVFISLIRLLIRGDFTTLHKALISLLSLKLSKQLNHVEALCDVYMEEPETRRILIDKMGEVGLLSSTEARAILLNKTVPHHVWEVSCLKTPPRGSPEALTRISLELLCNSSSTAAFDIVRELNFVTDLSTCILKFYLSKCDEERIASMLFDGTFSPPLAFETQDHVAFEVFFSIQSLGPIEIIQRLRNLITNSPLVPPRTKHIYHKAANAAFSNICHAFCKKLPKICIINIDRLKEILLVSSRFIDFKLCDIEILLINSGPMLTSMVLEEYQSRYSHDDSYKDLGDRLFSKALSQDLVGEVWFELLDMYHRLMGDKSCSTLLNHRSIGWYDYTSARVDRVMEKYASEHLQEYITAILERFPVIDSRDLTSLNTVVSRAIGKLGRKIILAGRVYISTRMVNDKREIAEERLRYPICAICKVNIEKHVYSDATMNFDVYFCTNCSSTTTRVACPICMSEDPPMIGNGCGHLICLSCINKISNTCPLCRAPALAPEIFWMSQEFAVQRFLAEWQRIIKALPACT